MSRGIGEGDLVHAKFPGGEFDHSEIYEVIDAFCDPNEFEWFVKAKLIRTGKLVRYAPKLFKFRLDQVKKVSALVALALCADD